MTTCLTLRNCPVEVHQALRSRAQRNRRSLNAEGVEVLRAALTSEARLPEEEFLRRLKSIPWGKKGLTLAETRAAIHEGRK